MTADGDGDERSPLARLCYEAGSTLDEVLLLEEEEFVLLSKEIVGNGVLNHARVLKQWRHCRVEALLRQEVEDELENYHNHHNSSIELEQEEQQEEPSSQRRKWEEEYYTKKKLQAENTNDNNNDKQDKMGEDWKEYLRAQIKKEMNEFEMVYEQPESPPYDALDYQEESTHDSRNHSRRGNSPSPMTKEPSSSSYPPIPNVIQCSPYRCFEDQSTFSAVFSCSSDDGSDPSCPHTIAATVLSQAADLISVVDNGLTYFFNPDESLEKSGDRTALVSPMKTRKRSSSSRSYSSGRSYGSGIGTTRQSSIQSSHSWRGNVGLQDKTRFQC